MTTDKGFVEGCVVEIEWDDGHCKIVCWWAKIEWRWEKIRSLRPLSGPMAIWNHAPDWADVLLTSGQGLYRFFTNEEWAKWSAMMFDGEHDTLTTRPFWAPKKA